MVRELPRPSYGQRQFFDCLIRLLLPFLGHVPRATLDRRPSVVIEMVLKESLGILLVTRKANQSGLENPLDRPCFSITGRSAFLFEKNPPLPPFLQASFSEQTKRIFFAHNRHTQALPWTAWLVLALNWGMFTFGEL